MLQNTFSRYSFHAIQYVRNLNLSSKRRTSRLFEEEYSAGKICKAAYLDPHRLPDLFAIVRSGQNYYRIFDLATKVKQFCDGPEMAELRKMPMMCEIYC